MAIVFIGSRRAVKAPVLKSVINVPTVTTWSQDSTYARTSGFISLPSYIPMKDGCCSSRTDLSANIVANGMPLASTKACSCDCSPTRRTSHPGRMHAASAISSADKIASVAALTLSGILRRDDRRRAYHGTGHLREEVELAVSQGVVDQLPLVLGGRRRHAGQVEDGNVLRVRSADGADRAELPDTVRGAQSTDAANARVPVGGVSRVQLVAAAEPVNAPVLDDGVLNGE